ncbi:MAG: NAD(P)-dependent oxidoreductase, partial [Candidatus Aminicenantia bacterium]
MKRIGFIGLGLMGKPMALNLIKKGYEVGVYNRTFDKTKSFEGKAEIFKKPSDLVKGRDVVITMVRDHRAVEEVIFGIDGAIFGAEKGTTFIDMSTISPDSSKYFAGKLKEKGFHFLDAPVSGSTWAAESGTLAIMVGGEREVFEKHKEILESLGSKIVYMGESGTGSLMKLVNNLIGACWTVSLAEGLILARNGGLDLSAVLEVLNAGAYKSPLVEIKGSKMVKADYSPQFSLDLMYKDLNYIVESLQKNGVFAPVTSLVREIFKVSFEKGLGDFDYSSVIETLKKV